MTRASFEQRITAIWYQPTRHWLVWLLLPFAWLYFLVISLRRLAYRLGLKKTYQAPVPVIVVGNITVGGTGKTPMVIWLVEFLRQQGFNPGVISRGYGAVLTSPVLVSSQSTAKQVGDEPLLIHLKTRAPVAVFSRRAESARYLLQQHPECDVIISDDGLQHYALARQVEIALLDGARRCGNRQLLPAGPLREPCQRLNAVDFVVTTGDDNQSTLSMQLKPERLYALQNPEETLELSTLQNRAVHAVAGIANPGRFFATLRTMGLSIIEHPFSDHYDFIEQSLNFGDDASVVMTEKDAVKCHSFARPNWFALSVCAQLPTSFSEQLMEKLSKRNC